MLFFQSMWIQKIIWVIEASDDTLVRDSKNVLIFFCITVYFFVFLDVPNELKKLKLLNTWHQKWTCINHQPSIIQSYCPDINRVRNYLTILQFTIGSILPYWFSNCLKKSSFQQIMRCSLSIRCNFLCYIFLIYFYLFWGTLTLLICDWHLCLQLVLLSISVFSMKPDWKWCYNHICAMLEEKNSS